MQFKVTLVGLILVGGTTLIFRVETDAVDGSSYTLVVKSVVAGMPRGGALRVEGIEGVDREIAEHVARAARGMWDRQSGLGTVAVGSALEGVSLAA